MVWRKEGCRTQQPRTVDWNLSSDTDDCDDCDISGGDDSLESYPPESTETRTEKATITLASERWRELLVPSGRKLCRGWTESLAAELQNVLVTRHSMHLDIPARVHHAGK